MLLEGSNRTEEISYIHVNYSWGKVFSSMNAQEYMLNGYVFIYNGVWEYILSGFWDVFYIFRVILTIFRFKKVKNQLKTKKKIITFPHRWAKNEVLPIIWSMRTYAFPYSKEMNGRDDQFSCHFPWSTRVLSSWIEGKPFPWSEKYIKKNYFSH